MLSNNSSQLTLEKIMLGKDKLPSKIEIKSGESNRSFTCPVPSELKGVYEICNGNKSNFFIVYNNIKILLDERLVATEGYAIFDKIFEGLTHTLSYKSAKYVLGKDLIGKVVKTLKGQLAGYLSYKEAAEKLYKAFESKIYGEVGKPLQEGPGMAHSKNDTFTKEKADALCGLVTNYTKEYLEHKKGIVPAKIER